VGRHRLVDPTLCATQSLSEGTMGHHTNGLARLVQGLTLGAAAMYLLDPDKGRRRRAITRDKLQRFANDSLRLANQATRDASHRLHGVNARMQQRIMPEGDVDELRLIERVRSALGRCVSHPHALQVGARGSTIVLSGPVLRHEIGALLAAVRAVAGVGAVENHLDAHDSSDGIPSLQGEGRQRGNGGAQNWTPALRMSALLGAGAMTLYGMGKRGATGMLLAGAGMALATRVVRNDTCAQASGGTLSMPSDADSGSDTAVGDDGTPRAARPDASAVRKEAMSGETSLAQDVPLLGDDGTPAAPQRMSGNRSATEEMLPAPDERGQPRFDRPPL
jgi:hypothetical protein